MAKITGQRVGAGRVGRLAAATASVAMLATVLAAPAGAQDALLCRGETPTIVGTEGADTLIGTDGFDVIMGLGGNDTIVGLDGSDLICGGDGNDNIRAGRGEDIIFGGAGNDNIRGNQEADRIFGGDGNDNIRGQNGADFIDGENGDDTILGGRGKDTIFGRHGDDEIGGGNNDDTIFGGLGDDILRGGNAADLINSGHGDDSVRGGIGVDEVVTGFFLGDEVNTGDRDDIINGQLESTITPPPAERASTPANRADTLAEVEANWVTGAWSREQTVKQLVAQGHNTDDINFAIDEFNVDFGFHARLDADFQLRNGNLSRDALIDQLNLGAQFTRAEAVAAVDAIAPDFVAEAVAFAQGQIDNQALSRARLIENVTSDFQGRFTEAEAVAAIDLINVDFEDEAVQYARQIGGETFSCQGLQTAATGFFGQFTPAEALHAGEVLGVC